MDHSHRDPLASPGAREYLPEQYGGASSETGFTLIEVLVALAVMVTVMSALVLAGTTRVENVSYVRDRTIATWIASDRLTELRLEQQWPDTGMRDGEVESVGRTWQWRAEITSTPNEHIRRVNVTVRLHGAGNRLTRVVGFVSDPDIRAAPEGSS